TTSAHRSPSSMAQKGPAPTPASSTTRTPASGPIGAPPGGYGCPAGAEPARPLLADGGEQQHEGAAGDQAVPDERPERVGAQEPEQAPDRQEARARGDKALPDDRPERGAAQERERPPDRQEARSRRGAEADHQLGGGLPGGVQLPELEDASAKDSREREEGGAAGGGA